MPIQQHNCESFYQGTFAEHHVRSLFYFNGYEAQKVSPDIGIDLMVTNLARARFRGEAPVSVEIQVKSVLLDAQGGAVCLNPDELEFLSVGAERYCVVVVLHGLAGSTDPGSYERGDDPDASNAVDRDLLSRHVSEAAHDGRRMRRDGAMSIHDFNSVKTEIFWLHSSQISKMKREGLWRTWDGKFFLDIRLTEFGLTAGGSDLIAELRDVGYIVGYCRAAARLRQGDYSMRHY